MLAVLFSLMFFGGHTALGTPAGGADSLNPQALAQEFNARTAARNSTKEALEELLAAHISSRALRFQIVSGERLKLLDDLIVRWDKIKNAEPVAAVFIEAFPSFSESLLAIEADSNLLQTMLVSASHYREAVHAYAISHWAKMILEGSALLPELERASNNNPYLLPLYQTLIFHSGCTQSGDQNGN